MSVKRHLYPFNNQKHGWLLLTSMIFHLSRFLLCFLILNSCDNEKFSKSQIHNVELIELIYLKNSRHEKKVIYPKNTIIDSIDEHGNIIYLKQWFCDSMDINHLGALYFELNFLDAHKNVVLSFDAINYSASIQDSTKKAPFIVYNKKYGSYFPNCIIRID